MLRLAAPLVWVALVAVLAHPVRHLAIDNDNWLPPEHRVSRALDRLEQDFALTEGALVVVPLDAPYFASAAMRAEVERLESALSALPGVGATQSAASARTLIPLPGDTLRVASYGDMHKEGSLGLEAWRDHFGAGPYGRRLLSADGLLAAVHLEMAPVPAADLAEERRLLYARLRQAMAGLGWADGYHLVGDASLKGQLDQMLSADLRRLLWACFGLAVLGLLAVTRSLRRTLFVSLVCGGCVLVALGTMVRLGAPFTAVGLVLPVLVLVVALADALHVLARFDAERGDWRRTVRATALPCLAASLTTAAGCLSFVATPIVSLQQFAMHASLSVMLAYPMLLVPLWGAMRYWPQLLGGGSTAARRGLQPVGGRVWLGVWGGFALLFAAALPWAHAESDFLSIFFARDSETRRGFEVVDARLGGSGVLEIILDAQPEHFRHIAGRDQVAALERRLRARVPWLRDIDSYLKPLAVAQRALAADARPTADDEGALLAQSLFFLELSQSHDDSGVLAPWMSSDGAVARLRLITPHLSSRQMAEVEDAVHAALAPLRAQGVAATLSGSASYVRYLSSRVLASQGRAAALALALVAVLMLLVLGWRWGLIGLAINLPPLLMTAGSIVWLGWPFDFGTILVTSITLGLVVDSSLHLLAAARAQSAVPSRQAVLAALGHCWLPIWRATLIISGGLAVLLLSDLALVQRFAALSIWGLWLGFGCALTLPLGLAGHRRARPL